MGHKVSGKWAYRRLQQQMDHAPTGAPPAPELTRILEILFTPEDAALAARIPTQPTPLPKLAAKLALPEAEAADRLTGFARRGLVVDVEAEGQRFFALAPVLGGVFEFIMMRAREDLPAAELARLFEAYMNRNPGFGHQAYAGETQFARAFVREGALPQDDHTEVLDWERVTQVIETASAITVGLCACRHNRSHLGQACDAPQRTCISLNGGAEAMAQMDISTRISAKEALKIVEECRDYGLANMGDNVQQEVTFLCNCCGCCCTMIRSMKAYNLNHAIVSSNWIAAPQAGACTACGACVQACPVDALALPPADSSGAPRPAELDEDLCLGCGVCATQCPSGAIVMRPRERRVFTPETAFDKLVHMAVERGKLAEVVFESPETLTGRALGRVLALLEKTPPVKAALAVKPLRSAYFNALVKRMKR